MSRTRRTHPRIIPVASVLALALAGAGCAASTAAIRARAVSRPSGALAAKRLTRSPFKKPPDRDNMDEDVIQRVINAPLEPELPARAGVVALDAPFTRRAYTTLTPGDRAPQLLARRLERSKHFVMVSDISPHLVKGQSIEALRELATRYRLKYLVIMNRRFANRSRYNAWGWSWISLLAIPFAPAYTLDTVGLLEATLMDVRTGTFLFTTQVHVEAAQRTTPWSTDGKLDLLMQRAGRRAAHLLARTFLAKCRRLIAYVKRERAQLARARAKLQRAVRRARAAAPGGAPTAVARPTAAARPPAGGQTTVEAR